LHSTLLYLVLPPANCSRGRPSPGRSCDATTLVSRNCPPASRATTLASRNLPRNAAVAPWPQPPTRRNGCALAAQRPCRVCQGRCHSRLATLKIKGKNQKIIWPNMGSNATPLGRSKNISTTRPPPLMSYFVLFKVTYNCLFVNNLMYIASLYQNYGLGTCRLYFRPAAQPGTCTIRYCLISVPGHTWLSFHTVLSREELNSMVSRGTTQISCKKLSLIMDKLPPII
jgi:hypothetical protein